MNRNQIITGVVLVAVVLGGIRLFTPTPTVIVDTSAFSNVVRDIYEEGSLVKGLQLGASGDIYGNTVTFNDGASYSGAVLRGVGKRFDRGTTTVCSLRSPTNATSTLVALNINMFDNTTTTERILYVATSSVPYATTTSFWTVTVPGNSKLHASIPVAATSSAHGFSSKILAPGEYVTFSFKGGTHIWGVGTTTELNGSCSAILLTEGR